MCDDEVGMGGFNAQDYGPPPVDTSLDEDIGAEGEDSFSYRGDSRQDYYTESQNTTQETIDEEEEDLFGGFSKNKGKGPQQPAKKDEKKPAKSEPKPSSAPKDKKGLFNGIANYISKLTTSKEVYLPDDKDKSLVYDKELKKWVDKNAEDDGAVSKPLPPPPMSMPRKIPDGGSNRGGPAAGPPMGATPSPPMATSASPNPSLMNTMPPPHNKPSPSMMPPPSQPSPPSMMTMPPHQPSPPPPVEPTPPLMETPEPPQPQPQPTAETHDAAQEEPEPLSKTKLLRSKRQRKTLLERSREIQEKEAAKAKAEGTASPFSMRKGTRGGGAARRGANRYQSVLGADAIKSSPSLAVLDPMANLQSPTSEDGPPQSTESNGQMPAFFDPSRMGQPQQQSRSSRGGKTNR